MTEADEAVDDFLRSSIKSNFPGSAILTEEKTAPSTYSKLALLENLWVADPLDGTANFSRGRSNHAVTAALVRKGLVVACAVYIPQSQDLYWAQKDQEGAFHQDKEGVVSNIHVSEILDPRLASIGIDWVADYPDLKDSLKTFGYFSKLIRIPRRQFLSMGSAVSDLTHLASGELEAYLNCGLYPWDVLPYFLVEKAGGRVTTPNGESYNIFKRDILATNERLHNFFLEKLAD